MDDSDLDSKEILIASYPDDDAMSVAHRMEHQTYFCKS